LTPMSSWQAAKTAGLGDNNWGALLFLSPQLAKRENILFRQPHLGASSDHQLLHAMQPLSHWP
jgi:hypothetical protein